jgi:hypothetical protein
MHQIPVIYLINQAILPDQAFLAHLPCVVLQLTKMEICFLVSSTIHCLPERVAVVAGGNFTYTWAQNKSF